MYAKSCQHVSWYALERHTLGQLSPEENQRVEQACQCNSAIRQRREAIERDTRSMPPLSFVSESARQQRFPFSYRVVVGAVGVMTVLGFLYLGLRSSSAPLETTPDSLGIKGGDLSVHVVRERSGRTSHLPTTFLESDRFRFYVSSSGQTNGQTPVEVTVFQGKQVFFPYDRPLKIDAGNFKGLPKSFQFSGDQKVRACIATGDPLPSRDQIRRQGVKALPESTVCVDLKPE